ncbi:hypothetical protein NEIRO03_0391 [Nematocida sp. AWRm78]|nr:hypothetical protein NEIRO02_0365 [Nematocida sp. AWRm79]KAI5182740.1 hypothetical protein NEIRO03_0391 [Nematocida sp. AWRm78]
MKKTIAAQQNYFLQTSKRRAPESWREINQRYSKETKQDELARVSEETKSSLLGTNPNTQIIKKSRPLSMQSMLIYTALCPSFIKVVYLAETQMGISPVEIYSKDLPTLTADSTVKKVRYSSCNTQPVPLLDKSMKVYQGMFQIPSSMVPIAEMDKLPKKTRLTMLIKLLSISIALNQPVLDINSIFIQKTSDDLLYIPSSNKKKKSTCVSEYMVCVLGLLLDTYTIMERAKLMQALDKTKEEAGDLLKIASLIYDGMKGKEWESAYINATKHLSSIVNTL